MADTVQVVMEKMIPELEDLQEKKLFSADEIHQIVEKRRDFEYMMRRVPLRKIDGLRYIEYELNLEALRKKRKARLGLKKITISDTAGIKRVHAVFDRLLYKHRGDVDLWLQYVEFCKTEGSGRVLSHVFTRALQSHPRSAALWIEAASFEFSFNLSVDAARVLMQRALRINRHEPKLWLEYFRLELLYIQKLSVRREVLQLDEPESTKDEETNDASTVLLDELPEERDGGNDEDDEAMAAVNEKKRTRAMILDGAIPRIIFQNAITAIPDDVAFRLQFIEISDLFGRRFAANLSQTILESCVADFATSELVHAVQALRPFVVEDDVEAAERQSIALFEASVKQLQTATMKEKFCEWLVERAAAPDRSAFLLDAATKVLKTHAEESIEVLVRYVDLVQRTEGTARAIAVLQELQHASEVMRASATLYVLHSQLVLHADAHLVDTDDHASDSKRGPATKRRRTSDKHSPAAHPKRQPLTEALAIVRDGLKHVKADDADGRFMLSQRLLQLLTGDHHARASAIDDAYQVAMKAQTRGSANWHAVRQQYLTWAATALPIATVRAMYKRFLEDGQLLPDDATYAFLSRCVEIETAAVPSKLNVDAVRSLFERLVDLFGRATEDVWLEYIQFFKDNGRYEDANRVLHRATRVWKESTRLQQLLA
ncbi:hypothetical protein P43SY_008075 [Pythium insidiosum]|uniref:U3 small nucleolar RNA-associated protein 6 n=1 Tax=Pythium insidiosum TaxID=114742 RepID=A0AAD5QBD8_PYTIN|nr:hypothetical protein P43SY_008075 [Pythium insidiosum]